MGGIEKLSFFESAILEQLLKHMQYSVCIRLKDFSYLISSLVVLMPIPITELEVVDKVFAIAGKTPLQNKSNS